MTYNGKKALDYKETKDDFEIFLYFRPRLKEEN